MAKSAKLNIHELRKNNQLLASEVLSRVRSIAMLGPISEESRSYIHDACTDALKRDMVEKVHVIETEDGIIDDVYFTHECSARIEHLKRERRQGYIPFEVAFEGNTEERSIRLKKKTDIHRITKTATYSTRITISDLLEIAHEL